MTIEEILAASKQAQEMTGEAALSALVGEGKKYATMEDMAKGALNGQAHIEKLELEAAAYKTDATKQKGVDELLAMINKQTDTSTNDQSTEHNSEPVSFGKEDVSAMIAEALGAKDNLAADKVREANQKLVVDELVKLHGDKALDVYKAISSRLHADLNALAGDSPSLVLELIGSKTTGTQQSNLPASQRINSLVPDNAGVLTKKNIQKMYDAGEIDRYKKVSLENEQYAALGHDKFFS